jgi:hypothetical protein
VAHGHPKREPIATPFNFSIFFINFLSLYIYIFFIKIDMYRHLIGIEVSLTEFVKNFNKI